MVVAAKADDLSIVLRFGAGLSTRASSDEIDPSECADGENFALDFGDTEFTPRKPFKLLGTTANTSSINGFFQLRKQDGTIGPIMVQSGTAVFPWNGTTFGASVGTVNVGAKLRGPKQHIFGLDDKVIVTDLALLENVKEWDGTTFQDATFTGVTGLKAKYCTVVNERAWFGNLIENAVALPHVIAASTRSLFTTMSVSNRPSSALAITDPFQFPTPDLRAVNGLVEAFEIIVASTEKGNLYKITGESAKINEVGLTPYAILPLYPDSGASGTEAVTFVGNDIFYGRPGRIESLASTDRFGNVETDDLSLKITPDIQTFTDWTVVYNSRFQRVYCFPTGEAEVWVLHKNLLPNQLSTQSIIDTPSPWSKWTTQHVSSFNITAAMSLLDPVTGEEFTYFGDSVGNFYQMEGDSAGDAGSAAISAKRVSGVFSAPLDAQAYDFEGYIRYRAAEAVTVTITLQHQGTNVFDKFITVSLPATPGNFYGGQVFYGGIFYYGGTFRGRLKRQSFPVAGGSNEVQIEVSANTTAAFRVNEIGLRFAAAS